MTAAVPRPGIAAQAIALRLAGRRVLENIGMTLVRGELVGIIGPNGAGKSSLLKVIAGQRLADAGTITIDGRPCPGIDRRDLARALAYLPQERLVHWPLPVEDVVALGRLPHGSTGTALSSSDRSAVNGAITTMDLEALRHRPATELSGGELVRTLIARTLAQETPYVLADEPVAGLDPAHQIALFERLRALAEAGRGIAVALHDLTLAVRYCHRVVVLAGGRGIAAGAPREVLTAELVRRVYGVEAFAGEIAGLPAVLPLRLSSGAAAAPSGEPPP